MILAIATLVIRSNGLFNRYDQRCGGLVYNQTSECWVTDLKRKGMTMFTATELQWQLVVCTAPAVTRARGTKVREVLQLASLADPISEGRLVPSIAPNHHLLSPAAGRGDCRLRAVATVGRPSRRRVSPLMAWSGGSVTVVAPRIRE